jgi:hypothetical protein
MRFVLSRLPRIAGDYSTKDHRSAPPIPEGLGGGEAMRDHREQMRYNAMTSVTS